MRSLPTVETVRELIRDHYPLGPCKAVLIRSFTNDVYRIDAGEGAYALKIYGCGRFSADEVRWEQELARHLVASGVQVPDVIPLHGGDTVGVIDAPEGQRAFALTEWLPGAKPEPPWTDDLYRRVGGSLAHLHQVADTFTCSYARRQVRTGDEPAQVAAALADDPVRRRLVDSCAAAAGDALATLAGRGLHRGVLHGDPSLDNLHLVGNEVRFYDLDLAGPGWQIEDLTGAMSTDHADAFLDGYTAVRSLPAVELDALPWLGLLARIDNLHFHLITKPLTQGTASLAEGWVEAGFTALADTARHLGVGS
ncbi:Ser/Thr protein kinase RdoA involved in Cpx stress response, MazF antagonist [Microlunatus soli]|uniref:Ser/Thr protein kinase RdoA involved in Cpx stress response, MazF antagonist n=1 Tax=Microlunatus soli TaxID=630515 RepID=A0A1H1SHG8_9ACTN|nr:Ser/Thr protein kinase RdoA involved in Cpx stress response, MazF antagonist [Microlunatus soli]